MCTTLLNKKHPKQSWGWKAIMIWKEDFKDRVTSPCNLYGWKKGKNVAQSTGYFTPFTDQFPYTAHSGFFHLCPSKKQAIESGFGDKLHFIRVTFSSKEAFLGYHKPRTDNNL